MGRHFILVLALCSEPQGGRERDKTPPLLLSFSAPVSAVTVFFLAPSSLPSMPALRPAKQVSMVKQQGPGETPAEQCSQALGPLACL